jgi:CBS domain-containing protein
MIATIAGIRTHGVDPNVGRTGRTRSRYPDADRQASERNVITQVKDIMTRDAITVSPQSTLREVAEVLSRYHIGGAPVVVGGDRVVGIVSASDLIDFVAVSPGVPTPVQDSVASEEITDASSTAQDADAPYCFLDFWADVGADVLERFHATAGPEWNTLEEHTVDEIMTRRLLSVEPDTTVEDAAQLMLDQGVHRLLVVHNGRLQGVVSTRDLLLVVADS